MTELGAATSLSELADVVREYDLVEIRPYEHRALRVENSITDEDQTEPVLEVMIRQGPGELETRFKMTVTGPSMELVADVGVRFVADEQYQVAESVMPAFMSDVSLMAAYPYLRESVSTSAARLGLTIPVLGFLRRGQITFGTPEKTDSSQG